MMNDKLKWVLAIMPLCIIASMIMYLIGVFFWEYSVWLPITCFAVWIIFTVWITWGIKYLTE